VLQPKCNGRRLSYPVCPQEGDPGQVYLSEMVGDRCIGVGSMGTVYGGFGPEGEEVAIKMVFPEHFESLKQEWRMYTQLSRRGLAGEAIPRCLGFYQHSEFAILVTELLGAQMPPTEALDRNDRPVTQSPCLLPDLKPQHPLGEALWPSSKDCMTLASCTMICVRKTF